MLVTHRREAGITYDALLALQQDDQNIEGFCHNAESKQTNLSPQNVISHKKFLKK